MPCHDFMVLRCLGGITWKRRLTMPPPVTSPSSVAGKRASPSSPARSSSSGSPTSRGATASPSPATPSFFIIQEPNHDAVIRSTPHSPTNSDVAAKTDKPTKVTTPASRIDLERQRNALASRQSLQPTHSLNSGSPGRRRGPRDRSASRDAPILQEETDEDLLGDGEDRDDSSKNASSLEAGKHRVLSILNRVGSSPDLPLSNSWSAAVFSSSKKRQLMKPTNGTGASPHLAGMQRSRLIPLPINIRTGTLKKRDADDDFNTTAISSLGVRSSSLGSLQPAPRPTEPSDVEEERMNYEISIASLKQRVAHMEKERAKALKHRHVIESQLDAMTKELKAVQNEKTQLSKKLDDYEKANLHQRQAFDKLSQRYSIVYENLAKLSNAATLASTAEGGDGNPANVASVHLVLQTLTKENQELQRKVHVLETRHADDKIIVGNQEKQIKRLRAEMEALQHMAGSKDDTATASSSLTKPSPGEPTSGNRFAVSRIESSHAVIPAATAASNSAPHQGAAVSEEYAYIDPNILKVLEKVDSQFSITNAISLSAVLKKWLHSCLHVVASTDTHAVLHVLLKRVCELMHCQHAAIFHVDHSSKKLVGVVSERGRVRWELPLDKGILGHAARQNVLCNVRKAYDDPRFFSSSDTITNTKSREVLCIPLTRELDHFQPDQASTIANNSVFAVLQCWNTTTQKPFSHNDQILGGLLGIQAGIVFSQTNLTDNLQRIHSRVLQIVHMNEELAAKAFARVQPQDVGDALAGSGSAVSIVQLVRAAQRKFAEIVGITKLRIYIFDADTERIWYAGAQLDATASSSSEVQLVPIRKYANVLSSLCTLVLPSLGSVHQDGRNSKDASSCRILLDPTAEPSFNDTVDLKGGANGLYLAPILSPWRDLPLGMIQVARTGSALQSSTSVPIESRPVSAAVKQERAHAQHVDDTLTMELIQLFCQQFAGLLHHALALQLHETCSPEVQQAQLAYLTDRLDLLETEYLREQEEAEAEAEMMAKQTTANVRLEQRLLQSVLHGDREDATTATSRSSVSSRSSRSSRPGSAMTTRMRGEERNVLEPVPLISTDSSYAIDVLDLGNSSSTSPDGTPSTSEEAPSSRDQDGGDSSGSAVSSLSSPQSF